MKFLLFIKILQSFHIPCVIEAWFLVAICEGGVGGLLVRYTIKK